MPPLLFVLFLIWAAPHDRIRPMAGSFFERPLLPPSPSSIAPAPDSLAQQAAHFLSSLMATTYMAAIL